MNRSLALAASAALLALTACGGGSQGRSVPAPVEPLAIRHAEEVLGGIPLVRLQVLLFDAPLPFAGAQVNVALTGIGLVSASGAVVPYVSYATPLVVNLLALQSAPLPLGGTVPSGSYTALRFFIDPAASNIVLGPMTIPLGTSTSLTADAPLAMIASAGQSLSVTADFNVLQSFSMQGASAGMHPTIVASQNAGAVTGLVLSAKGKPVSNATVQAVRAGGSVANTTVSGSDGTFRLHALAAGTYTIVVLNAYVTPWGDAVRAAGNDANAAPKATVTVGAGTTSALGTLTD